MIEVVQVVVDRLDAAERAEVEAVVALDAAASVAPWSAETWASELATAGRRYLVARIDGEVVGVTGLADLAGEGHVMALAVAPAMQRRGVGRRLVEALLAEADAADLERMTLEVRVSNARARRLYRRAGFVEDGVRPGYYADGEDAVVAWRR